MPIPDGTSTTQPSTNSSRWTPWGVPAGFPHGSCGEATAPAVSVNRSPTPIGRGSFAYPAPPHPAASRLAAIAGSYRQDSPGGTRTVRPNARGRGQGKRPPSMGHSASPGVPFRGTRGDDQNRTGVDGFAGRCLTTRPRRLDGASVPARTSPPMHPRARACENQPHGGGGSREPEGWRRQDHDGRQRGRRARPVGPPDAARRPRPAGLGRQRAVGVGRGRARLQRAVRGEGQARRRLPGARGVVPARRAARRPRAGRRRGGAARRHAPSRPARRRPRPRSATTGR